MDSYTEELTNLSVNKEKQNICNSEIKNVHKQNQGLNNNIKSNDKAVLNLYNIVSNSTDADNFDGSVRDGVLNVPGTAPLFIVFIDNLLNTQIGCETDRETNENGKQQKSAEMMTKKLNINCKKKTTNT